MARWLCALRFNSTNISLPGGDLALNNIWKQSCRGLNLYWCIIIVCLSGTLSALLWCNDQQPTANLSVANQWYVWSISKIKEKAETWTTQLMLTESVVFVPGMCSSIRSFSDKWQVAFNGEDSQRSKSYAYCEWTELKSVPKPCFMRDTQLRSIREKLSLEKKKKSYLGYVGLIDFSWMILLRDKDKKGKVSE